MGFNLGFKGVTYIKKNLRQVGYLQELLLSVYTPLPFVYTA